MVRTQQEIKEMIAALEEVKASVPEFGFFGNNWKPINAQIRILQGVDYEDFENEEYEIESAAYEAKEWLEHKDYPSLVE